MHPSLKEGIWRVIDKDGLIKDICVILCLNLGKKVSPIPIIVIYCVSVVVTCLV
jgi:hypothetical protein